MMTMKPGGWPLTRTQDECTMSRIILFNKPYGVLSQFTSEDGHPGLGEFISEPGFYAAGRLDADSEGLLILTDDGGLQHRLAHPRHKQPKTYWAQVEGEPGEADLDRLRAGAQLPDDRARYRPHLAARQ
jgi:23S rRNA pseudouridine2457 synthase